MTRRRQWAILGTLTAIYLVGLGVLAGIASERVRFDAVRTSLVRQFAEATQRARAHADRSLSGVLRVAHAFRGLGDRQVVEQCLIIAASLGGGRTTFEITATPDLDQ